MNIDVNRSSDDDDDDDDDYNGYAGRNGIDLFTPVRGRQRSLVRDFTPTPSRSTSSGEAASSSFQSATQQKNEKKEKKQKNPWFGTNKNKDKSKSDNDNDDDDDDDPIYASFEADPLLHAAQDTSWLGARLSPIPHGETETKAKPKIKAKANNPSEKGGNENNRDHPRNESSGDASSSVVSAFFQDPHDDVFSEANFRTERDNDNDNNNDTFSANHSPAGEANHRRGGSRIRPRLSLWRPATTTGPSAGAGGYATLGPPANRGRRRRRRLKTPCPTSWSSVHPVPASAALVLVIVGIHDAFLSYLEVRNGVRTSVSRAWTLPWIGPSERSLLRFGAFCPRRMMMATASGRLARDALRACWRSLVSLCVPTSVAEWLLLAWVWNTLLGAKGGAGFATRPPRQLSWPVVYALSAGTGQLWMLVFELGRRGTEDWWQQQQQLQQQQQQQLQLPALSGCAGWATAGVLCSVGIRIPHRRFACFLASSVLVVLHQCQATGSSVGCAGAAFFGWALAGIWSSSSSSSSALRWSESTRVYAYSQYSREHSLPDPEAWQEVMPPRMASDLDRWGGRWTIGNGVAAGVVALLWSLPILFVVYR